MTRNFVANKNRVGLIDKSLDI